MMVFQLLPDVDEEDPDDEEDVPLELDDDDDPLEREDLELDESRELQFRLLYELLSDFLLFLLLL